jgi:uncharacterized cupin superfamily protein
MDNKIVLIHQSEVEKKKRFNTDKYQFYKREITKRSDFSQAYICIYDIPPLKAAYPMHYHEANTEAFYIIEGNGVVKTLTNDLNIKKGDVIVFPPGKEGAHQIVNTSKNELLTYIDFDTTNSPDICRYPDSDKVGIIIHNTSSEFYKASDQTDYYEGE